MYTHVFILMNYIAAETKWQNQTLKKINVM